MEELGAPIVWQIGPWVPGRRTTLEFLPAVWLFGDNTDYRRENDENRSDISIRCSSFARSYS